MEYSEKSRILYLTVEDTLGFRQKTIFDDLKSDVMSFFEQANFVIFEHKDKTCSILKSRFSSRTTATICRVLGLKKKVRTYNHKDIKFDDRLTIKNVLCDPDKEYWFII